MVCVNLMLLADIVPYNLPIKPPVLSFPVNMPKGEDVVILLISICTLSAHPTNPPT